MLFQEHAGSGNQDTFFSSFYFKRCRPRSKCLGALSFGFSGWKQGLCSACLFPHLEQGVFMVGRLLAKRIGIYHAIFRLIASIAQ